MEASIPSPDLIVYLHRPLHILRNNIIKRGRPFEQSIEDEYLINIQKGYFSYFRQNLPAPVLILELDDLDFVSEKSTFRRIVELLNKKYNKEIYVEILKNP
jgi:deoxyadenosine/deoxycytidine kinase